MRLSQNIQQHKDGLVLMVQMPEPSIVCKSDDDYIDYARYCWSAIGEIKNTYADVNCYKEEFYLNTGAIKRDIRTVIIKGVPHYFNGNELTTPEQEAIEFLQSKIKDEALF